MSKSNWKEVLTKNLNEIFGLIAHVYIDRISCTAHFDKFSDKN